MEFSLCFILETNRFVFQILKKISQERSILEITALSTQKRGDKITNSIKSSADKDRRDNRILKIENQV